MGRKRKRIKARLVEMFGGKCQRCGYAKSVRALSFHHRDPSQKESKISDKLGWKTALHEAMKCDLLCANCHCEVEDAAVAAGSLIGSKHPTDNREIGGSIPSPPTI